MARRLGADSLRRSTGTASRAQRFVGGHAASLLEKDRFMRLPLIAPADLTDAQKPLYDDMKAGIATNFNDFKTLADNGALMGPWNPWLHEPRIGKAIWELTKAMSMEATLPDGPRQVAILVTGAHFDAAYELYAHIAVAKRDGMTRRGFQRSVPGASRPISMRKSPWLMMSPSRW
jgi:hypothetical protein